MLLAYRAELEPVLEQQVIQQPLLEQLRTMMPRALPVFGGSEPL